jgi:hypothetical protein
MISRYWRSSLDLEARFYQLWPDEVSNAITCVSTREGCSGVTMLDGVLAMLTRFSHLTRLKEAGEAANG